MVQLVQANVGKYASPSTSISEFFLYQLQPPPGVKFPKTFVVNSKYIPIYNIHKIHELAWRYIKYVVAYTRR